MKRRPFLQGLAVTSVAPLVTLPRVAQAEAPQPETVRQMMQRASDDIHDYLGLPRVVLPTEQEHPHAKVHHRDISDSREPFLNMQDMGNAGDYFSVHLSLKDPSGSGKGLLSVVQYFGPQHQLWHQSYIEEWDRLYWDRIRVLGCVREQYGPNAFPRFAQESTEVTGLSGIRLTFPQL